MVPVTLAILKRPVLHDTPQENLMWSMVDDSHNGIEIAILIEVLFEPGSASIQTASLFVEVIALTTADI